MNILLIFLMIFYADICLAGAWLQNKNHTQLIITTDFEIEDKYSKGYNNISLEYGMSQEKTIGINFYDRKNKRNYTYNNYIDFDQNLSFYNRKIISDKSKYILSSQKTIFIKPIGYEYRLLFGKNLEARSFINIESAIASNKIDPVNLSLDLTYGYNINDKSMFLFQNFNNYRHYKIKFIDEEENKKKIIIHKRILSKIMFSYVYKLNQNNSIQFGTSHRILPKLKKNTIFASIWIDI